MKIVEGRSSVTSRVASPLFTISLRLLVMLAPTPMRLEESSPYPATTSQAFGISSIIAFLFLR